MHSVAQDVSACVEMYSPPPPTIESFFNPILSLDVSTVQSWNGVSNTKPEDIQFAIFFVCPSENVGFVIFFIIIILSGSMDQLCGLLFSFIGSPATRKVQSLDF